ncbi:dynamin family protein [Bacillus sp. REN10]|uniref:dynamin family protein n=1 Tax=Bacillus sp. REN10 TaxID=2782541 RepID=UPI00193C03F0|nr:dynamin family protein [Bacillus sp. REN10]
MLNETLKEWLQRQRPTRALLVEKLTKLRAMMLKQNLHTLAGKCSDLIEKLDNMEYVIAFCGHFSAGKSTMINELMGENLLPSNPIPTSANVVKVKAGEPYAKVSFKEQGMKQFPFPYDIETIQAYCVNGDTVDEVEISHPVDHLPKGVAILDTPGIDSTDDAHRVSAESKLHVADIVFYMMDYNHVQSPVNFEFCQRLADMGKESYFIVNQIDKHLAFELSFHEFVQRIRSSFDEHDLSYKGLYFTSLKDDDHPHNEIHQLKALLSDKLATRKQAIIEHVMTEALLLALQFYHHQVERDQEKKESMQQLVANVRSMAELEEALTNVIREEEAMERRGQKYLQLFDQELDMIFNNAKLMDYYTRILAREFLESRELTFRVRGLFSKKKTQKERMERLHRFYKAINENRLAYIDIPLKKAMPAFLFNFGLLNDELREGIRQLQVKFPTSFLEEKVKRGALLSGDYVLTYAKDVTRELQLLYRRSLLPLIEPLERQALINAKKKKEQLLKERTELEQKKQAWEVLVRLNEQHETLYETLLELLEMQGEETITEDAFIAFGDQHVHKRKSSRKVVPIGEVAREWHKTSNEQPFIPVSLEKEVKELHRQTDLLSSVNGMETVVSHMRMRLNRLETNQYTIALFGAFSAGKSSFANALLGEHVLPVSPNPTTAAINEVRAPNETYSHGTVVIQFKTEEQLVKDVNQALELSEQTIEHIEDLYLLFEQHDRMMKEWKEQKKDKTDAKKTGEEEETAFPPLIQLPNEQFTFLRSALKGYPFMNKRLGKKEVQTIASYGEYVSIEEKACFVEKIEMYYSSPFTEQGMVLVDTPGAGSMNARHTEMAFHYIAKADSVVFVTYYNHAFSRTDQEFLIQLGRVKDYFEHDKMFFVVNAADLAESKKDLLDVMHHVEKNLLTCGIHQARIYPLSSHLSLYAKKAGAHRLQAEEEIRYRKMLQIALDEELPHAKQSLELSGMSLFEEQFVSFTKQQLALSTLRHAQFEIKQAIIELKRWMDLSQEEEVVKEQTRKQLIDQLHTARTYLQQRSVTLEQEAMKQEMEELLFYVKQRIFYRYNDEFKVIFSPAAFDQFDDTIVALHRFTNEIIRFVANDLTQEMRATTIRLQAFMQKSIQALQRNLEAELKEKMESVTLRYTEAPTIEWPSFQAGLHHIQASHFQSFLKKFESPTAFFAEGGNKMVRDEIEKALLHPVHDYVDRSGEQIQNTMRPIYRELLEEIRNDVMEQIENQTAGRLSILSTAIDLDHIQEIIHKLERGGRNY